MSVRTACCTADAAVYAYRSAACVRHALPACLQVVVNLYPFRETVTKSPEPAFEVGVENIDIGGPTMIRAAAKNHAHVAVVVDPADYAELLAKMAAGTGSAEFADFRKKLAWKAFQVRMSGRACT